MAAEFCFGLTTKVQRIHHYRMSVFANFARSSVLVMEKFLWGALVLFVHSCGSAPSDELCNPNPCVGLHRTVCLVVEQKEECYCDPGYVLDEEKDCILDTDTPCDPNPCSEPNKTRCHIEDGSAVCSCVAGYELDQNENCVPVTPCIPNPCKEPHKTICEAEGTKATCYCNEGYLLYGDDCLRPCDMPDVCPDSDRTICVNDGTSANCHCDPGLLAVGNSCVDDPCAPNPCHGDHKNTCIRQQDGFDCACDPGYEDVAGKCVLTDVRPCSKDGWCRQNPLPAGEDLYGIWVFDSQNIFWVGEAGTILRYDGQQLALMDSGVGVDLYGIWGSSLGDIWVTGADGVLLHYDGASWSQYQLPEDVPRQNIRYIWGYGPQAIYICGDDRLLLFYDGFEWSSIETKLSKDSNLHSIWGTGPFDVYIASDFGKLLHWDGEKIDVQVIADGAGLFHIDGSGPDDIRVATMNGTIYHFDGTEWKLTDQFPFTILLSSYVDAKGIAWVAGYDYVSNHGVLMRKVSDKWEEVDSQLAVYYTSVSGNGSGIVYASGGNGLAMEYASDELHRLTHGTRRFLKGVRTDGTNLYACGSLGRLISYNDGNWDIISTDIGDSFHSMCFDPSGNAVFAGAKGHVFAYDGQSFSMMDVGKEANLQDLECFEDGSIMVAGVDGTCALGTNDQWTILDTHTDLKIESLWFNSPVEGWAVGEKGLLMLYDGSGWSSVELPHPVASDFEDVHGAGPDSVYVVGKDGMIVHWDGETWSFDQSSINEDLNGVWATAADDVWIVGKHGVVLHNTGQGWYRVSSGTRNLLWKIWGDGATGIWIVGEGGTVLRHDP